MNKYNHNLSKPRTDLGYFHYQLYHLWTPNIHVWGQTSIYGFITWILPILDHMHHKPVAYDSFLSLYIGWRDWPTFCWHDDLNCWHDDLKPYQDDGMVHPFLTTCIYALWEPSFHGPWACRQRFLTTRSAHVYLKSPSSFPFMDHGQT